MLKMAVFSGLKRKSFRDAAKDKYKVLKRFKVIEANKKRGVILD